jgi:hypothetical protein
MRANPGRYRASYSAIVNQRTICFRRELDNITAPLTRASKQCPGKNRSHCSRSANRVYLSHAHAPAS